MDSFDLVVAEFMRESGFEATYLKLEEGSYDPATGTMVDAVTEIPIMAIMMDLTLQSNGLTNKVGTLIQAGDKELYVTPLEKLDPTAAPLVVNAASDKVKVGNVVYDIVTHKEINPTAQNAYVYLLYIRR